MAVEDIKHYIQRLKEVMWVLMDLQEPTVTPEDFLRHIDVLAKAAKIYPPKFQEPSFPLNGEDVELGWTFRDQFLKEFARVQVTEAAKAELLREIALLPARADQQSVAPSKL